MKWLADHKLGIWGFLVAVTYIPGIMSSAVSGRWAVIAMGIPVLGEIRFRFHPMVQIAIAAGLAWSIATLIVTPDVMDGVFQLSQMVVLIGVMGLASQQDSLDKIMTGLCLGVGVASFFCVLHMFGIQLFAQPNPYRYGDMFYNSEVLTEFAVILLVWALAARRPLLVLCTAVPVAANGSRIALAVLAVGMLFALWPKSWKNRLIVTGLIGAAAVGIVGTMTMMPDKLNSGVERIIIWMATAMAITPTGQGIGWFRAAYDHAEFAHSDVIQVAMELGLGSLFFAVVPVYAFRKRFNVAEQAAFVAVCVELVVSFPLRVPASAFVAGLLAGYMVRYRDVAVGFRDHGRSDHDSGFGDAYDGISDFEPCGFGSGNIPVRPALAEIPRLGRS